MIKTRIGGYSASKPPPPSTSRDGVEIMFNFSSVRDALLTVVETVAQSTGGRTGGPGPLRNLKNFLPQIA